MPRIDGQSGPQVTLMEDTSWERMWSGQVATLLSMSRPWVVLGLAALAGELGHLAWGRPPAVAWVSSGLTLAGVGLSAYVWHASRLAPQGRAHSTVTAAVVLGWLLVAVITGDGAALTSALLAILGGTLALSWNIRMHMRRQPVAPGQADPASRLSAWFKDAAAPAGLPGARMQVATVEPTRAAGTIALPPGERTADDAVKAARRVESGMKLPPGSLVIAPNEDRADMANFSMSDPRLIRRGIPWPGPSIPGGSMAAPLRIGVWQDGVPVLHTLNNHHLHAMGASGAGKSIGGGWNYAAEIITRRDSALVAADITKARQTFGALDAGGALHRFETGRDGARDLMERVYRSLPDRTNFLADQGLTKWREGCGLSYLVVWLEETPDIFDALTSKEQEHFMTIAKALRSAGGTLVISLQRATWDQIPTIVRGQMASLCFGLNDSSDARYGLSERQQLADVNPAEWGINYPGMAVLDAPGIEEGRVAMPLRTYQWGDGDDERASALMQAHASAFPAAARPVDPITAQVTGQPGAAPSPASVPARPAVVLSSAAPGAEDQDDDDQDDDTDEINREELMSAYLRTEDPNPDLPDVDPDDPIEVHPGDVPFEFEPGEKLSPAEARDVLAAQLAEWQRAGLGKFSPRDLRPVMERTGMGRAWIQARLREALDDPESAIWREDEDESGTYRLRAPAAV
jgi:hypothetical protein